MYKTVQELSQIPIKFGHEYYKIMPRIISRWCQKGKFEYKKVGRRYYVDKQVFIEYARFHYFTKVKKKKD